MADKIKSLEEILAVMQKEANDENAKSLSRFGISAQQAFGIKLPVLRKLAKVTGKDPNLADKLWNEGHHESKLLATMIGDPRNFPVEKADRWIRDIYSWDVCDQLTSNLLVKTAYAWELPGRWAPLEPEFERRAGIVMIVELTVHHKKAADEKLLQFVSLLRAHANDERNFVEKAVNWAVRQIGKRSAFLHPVMISLCHELLQTNSKPALWIAKDALRELESEKVKDRLGIS